MIRIIDINSAKKEDILTRDIKLESGVEATVAKVIADIRELGDEALLNYTEKFDGVRPQCLTATQAEFDSAYLNEDKEFIKTLEFAKANIERFHQNQVRSGFEIKGDDGTVLGQKITPIEKVGIYVPGGTARYPSTVLMNAIPAKLAGVKQIVMATPPARDGTIPSAILAAAKIAGVDTVIKAGGAQAIAALAYGTNSVPKVDKIVGPGNIFVATAKRMLYGMVDIDMIAGPSEILVIADATCNPEYVAADLLSQAEHDKLASAVMITDSAALAKEVALAIEKQLPLLPREDIARCSIEANGKIIVADNIADCVKISNEIAPEHLEICVDNPFDYLPLVKNAGSIFLGKNAPEALGDYLAGPNHTLPTSGTARFSSPLSVDDFIKKSSYLYYTDAALSKVKDKVVLFAGREGLDAHAKSVAIRCKKD